MEPKARKLALLVGNSEYGDATFTKLNVPEADVGSLARLLSDPDVGGFDDVKTLINESCDNIRRATARFYWDKGRDDLLVFYFSGHGVRDDEGRLYLALKDTELDL